MHLACGFRNKHYESSVVEFSKQFAKNMDDGLSIRWAWLKAAEYENDYTFHDNEGCVFFIEPSEYKSVITWDPVNNGEKKRPYGKPANSPGRWWTGSNSVPANGTVNGRTFI